jgi:NADH dehydrogenase FAD-containing subunit
VRKETTIKSERPRIVISGGGFTGLWATRAMAHVWADVMLIDEHNYHSFLPLLYQVAAAELEPEAIAYPLRSTLRHLPDTRFVQGRVSDVDLAARLVQTSGTARLGGRDGEDQLQLRAPALLVRNAGTPSPNLDG